MLVEQQMFLQGLMWKNICKYEDVCRLYRYCTETEQVVPEELQGFVTRINKFIEPFHMKISKGIDEVTGESCYALINTVDNTLSRLSSHYTANELEFFKKIVACIVDSDDGRVDSVTALNLADELDRKTTKKEADEIINKFSRDKWILEETGFISLSTRSILELAPYLQSTYKNAIDACCVCKKLVLQKVSCPECNAKLHRHCKEKYFRETNKSKCPQCNRLWTDL